MYSEQRIRALTPAFIRFPETFFACFRYKIFKYLNSKRDRMSSASAGVEDGKDAYPQTARRKCLLVRGPLQERRFSLRTFFFAVEKESMISVIKGNSFLL